MTTAQETKHVTKAMVRYYELKAEYPDAILFFRMGDFYEMFSDDARTASEILDLALPNQPAKKRERQAGR